MYFKETFTDIAQQITRDGHWTKTDYKSSHVVSHIVNLEIFERTLFSRNFAYAKFRENKTLAK